MGADAQQRWLGLKSDVVVNSQLLASAAGANVRAKLPQNFVDTKAPEFRGLLTALILSVLSFR